MPEAEVADEGG